jgi:hypothetical protein
MPTLLPKTLKVVPAPLIEVVPRAPPALELPDPVEFICGNCGSVLMCADDEEKVYPLVVLCSSCGSYNSTDV